MRTAFWSALMMGGGRAMMVEVWGALAMRKMVSMGLEGFARFVAAREARDRVAEAAVKRRGRVGVWGFRWEAMRARMRREKV